MNSAGLMGDSNNGGGWPTIGGELSPGIAAQQVGCASVCGPLLVFGI